MRVDVPPQEPKRTSMVYPWIVVIVLTMLYTSSFIDRTILNLLVKPLRADLDITDTEFSYLVGFAFVVIYTIVGIPMGRIADRSNRRWLIAVGVAAWSLTTASCGLAQTYWRLFASRVGVGIGEATLSPGAYSMIADYFPPTSLSRALSVFGIGIPVGTGLALMIGGPLVQTLTEIGPIDFPLVGVLKPWQTVFMIIGLPGLLLSLLVLVVIREPVRRESRALIKVEHASTRDIVRHIWALKGVYAPAFFGMGFSLIYCYGGTAWWPTYLQRVHHMSSAETGLFLGISTVVFGLLGSVVAGTLADRMISRGRGDGHLMIGIVFFTGMMLCGGLAPIVPWEWLSLVLVSANTFFVFNWVGTCGAMVQIATPNRMRGQMTAIYFFIINMMGQGLGPTSVALSTEHIFGFDEAVGYSLSLVAFVSVGIAIVILQLGRPPLRRLLAQRAEMLEAAE